MIAVLVWLFAAATAFAACTNVSGYLTLGAGATSPTPMNGTITIELRSSVTAGGANVTAQGSIDVTVRNGIFRQCMVAGPWIAHYHPDGYSAYDRYWVVPTAPSAYVGDIESRTTVNLSLVFPPGQLLPGTEGYSLQTIGGVATWAPCGGEMLSQFIVPLSALTSRLDQYGVPCPIADGPEGYVYTMVGGQAQWAAKGSAGTITGALKGNGAGAVSQAACADLSNAAASCSTDTTVATNITSGTLPAARLVTAIRAGGFQVMFSGADAVAGAVQYVTMPYACTVTDWAIAADTGTATVKLWRVADGGTAIPTASNTLSTSGFVLSSGTRIHSTILSDLSSTAISAYDTFGVNLFAMATATKVMFTLGCQK